MFSQRSAKQRRRAKNRKRTTRQPAVERMDPRVLLAADVFTSELGATMTLHDQCNLHSDPQGVVAIVALAEGDSAQDHSPLR